MISTYAFKDLMILPQTLHLRGVCPQFGTFTINFLDKDGVNLLHFSFRIDQQALVINENLSGKWGEEQKITDVPFPKGRPFVIRIELANEKAVRVFLDDHLLADLIWRADIRHASRVDLTDVEFALFREGGAVKSIPEDDAPLLSGRSGSPPPGDGGLSDVLARIGELIGIQNELVGRVGDLTVIVGELQKQYHGIEDGMKALTRGNSRTTNEVSSVPGKAA